MNVMIPEWQNCDRPSLFRLNKASIRERVDRNNLFMVWSAAAETHHKLTNAPMKELKGSICVSLSFISLSAFLQVFSSLSMQHGGFLWQGTIQRPLAAGAKRELSLVCSSPKLEQKWIQTETSDVLQKLRAGRVLQNVETKHLFLLFHGSRCHGIHRNYFCPILTSNNVLDWCNSTF